MKQIKRISLIVIACMVMLGMSVCMTNDAKASQKAPKFEKNEFFTFLVKQKRSYIYPLNIIHLDSRAKVTKVKSSNNDILTVEYEPGTKYIKYFPKKTGTSVVSCTVKQNGKTYKLKKTIKVLKADPFKSITVNGKQIYRKKSNVIYYYSMKKNVRVSFELKDGWTLKKMYYNYHQGKKISKNHKMKNGGKLKIKGEGKGKHTSVKIDVQNKEGEIFRFVICLYKHSKGMDYVLAPVAEQNILIGNN